MNNFQKKIGMAAITSCLLTTGVFLFANANTSVNITKQKVKPIVLQSGNGLLATEQIITI